MDLGKTTPGRPPAPDPGDTAEASGPAKATPEEAPPEDRGVG
ncbi:hypothetical protein AB0I60_11025 [Actinosynnema sp. NPDC050436]